MDVCEPVSVPEVWTEEPRELGRPCRLCPPAKPLPQQISPFRLPSNIRVAGGSVPSGHETTTYAYTGWQLGENCSLPRASFLDRATDIR
jgi:hypothetical protein